jgi:SAM-dependent methyltransferase
MLLDKHRRDWDELGELDPFWAVLSDPSRQFSRWESKEFFETGEAEIEQLLSVAQRLSYPASRTRALDFGCGIGRLTRPLAAHFQECVGVDISSSMLAKARELTRSFPNCSFIVNDGAGLAGIPSDSVDFIVSKLVLQHLPDKKTIHSCVREFIRVLKKDGLLVFQLPSFIPVRNRLQFRRRAYACLRMIGLRCNFIYQRLHLNPMRMNYLPQEVVFRITQSCGAKLLLVQPDPRELTGAIESSTYFVTK